MDKNACTKNNYRERVNPKVQVKLFSEIKIISSHNWIPVFYASCVFESVHGEKFEPYDRLNKDFPVAVTNFLLSRHKENGFYLDTEAERKRLSRLIAEQLEFQTKKIPIRLKRYGYPVRFSTY